MKVDKIRANDVVLHIPSGERWVVCGADNARGELVACGYPFPSLAKFEDLALLEQNHQAQTREEIEELRREGLERMIEPEADDSGEGYDGNISLTEAEIADDLRIERANARALLDKIAELSPALDAQRIRAQKAENAAYDMRVEMLNIAELCVEMRGTMSDESVLPTVKLQECERTLLAIRKIAGQYTD